MPQHSRIANSSGAVVVMFVIIVPVLIACLALAIDGFTLMLTYLEQNNNAEYAALAGLSACYRNGDDTASCQDAALSAVQATAAKNSYFLSAPDSVRGEEQDIAEVGTWNNTSRTFTIGSSTFPNAIRVKLPIPEGSRARSFFAGIFGVGELVTSSYSIAYCTSSSTTYCIPSLVEGL